MSVNETFDSNDCNYELEPSTFNVEDIFEIISDAVDAVFLPKLDRASTVKIQVKALEIIQQLLDMLLACLDEMIQHKMRKSIEAKEQCCRHRAYDRAQKRLIEQSIQDMLMAVRKRLLARLNNTKDYLAEIFNRRLKMREAIKKYWILEYIFNFYHFGTYPKEKFKNHNDYPVHYANNIPSQNFAYLVHQEFIPLPREERSIVKQFISFFERIFIQRSRYT